MITVETVIGKCVGIDIGSISDIVVGGNGNDYLQGDYFDTVVDSNGKPTQVPAAAPGNDNIDGGPGAGDGGWGGATALCRGRLLARSACGARLGPLGRPLNL